MNYDFAAIEKKWQANWEKTKPYAAITGDKRPKFYGLIEFPYPSGQGLHVGHPRPFTAMDIVTRKKRMQGYNVLFPIGFDAFGLPTENYAIKNHIHPAIVTKNNIENFTKQLQMLGYGFDWDRCVDTTDPKLLQVDAVDLPPDVQARSGLQDHHAGELVHQLQVRAGQRGSGRRRVRALRQRGHPQGEEPVDAEDHRVRPAPDRRSGRRGLHRAREDPAAQLDRPLHRRRGAPSQTTAGDEADGVHHPCRHPVRRHLHGHLPGASPAEEVAARSSGTGTPWPPIRTRPPHKSDFERTELNKEKTGVRLEGVEAINPVNGKDMPIFVSDYVLMGYGTGAIMGVPGHDQRDWEFAKKFGLPIIEVVAGGDVQQGGLHRQGRQRHHGQLRLPQRHDREGGHPRHDEVAGGAGHRPGQGQLQAARLGVLPPALLGRAHPHGVLREVRLGAPAGGPAAAACCREVESYEPTDDGEVPLSKMTDWVNTTCPCCGGPAKRETDTMPQWAGSCWYFLRYMDPHNDKALASKEALDYWSPVDWYNGGMEHTTLHLLYSRFWHKFLYDIGVVPTKEPYAKRTSHGMILGEGGEKMSKSRGNVVNPNDIVAQYGADTMRLYIMFIGDFEKAASWSNEAVKGCKRFLDRVLEPAGHRHRRGVHLRQRTSPSSTRPSRRSPRISTS